MEIFEYTNKGTREENQDFVLHRTIGNNAHLFIVADGMGGYVAGDIAAKSVAESIYEYVDAHINDNSSVDLLQDAVVFANEELSFRRYTYGGVDMGAVIVVMLLVGTTAYVTWLGDSRLYQYRGNELCFMTEDHSLVNKLSKIRCLTPEEIKRYSAIVTKSVMGDEKIGPIDIKVLSVATGDVFFLCSDGIHKAVEPIMLPISEVELKTFLDTNSDKFDDNFSLLRISI